MENIIKTVAPKPVEKTKGTDKKQEKAPTKRFDIGSLDSADSLKSIVDEVRQGDFSVRS